MARLRGTFHFALRELLVDPALLGTARELSVNDRRVRIVLPLESRREEDDPQPSEQDLDALFPARDPTPDLPGTAHVYTSVSAIPSGEIAHLQTVRVEVFFEGQVSADDFVEHGQPKESPAFDPALDDLHRAEEAAREALERLLEWIRVRGGQHWLGLGTEPPEGVGQAQLVDLDAGNRLPVTSSLPVVLIHQIRDEQVLGSELLYEAISLVNRREEPPLADSLLADAIFMAQDAEPTDLPRALLIAAIACEVKIKPSSASARLRHNGTSSTCFSPTRATGPSPPSRTSTPH